MFNFVKPFLPTLLLVAITLHVSGQQSENLFTKTKSKKALPIANPSEEEVIDGSLNRSTIFNSAPLFQLNHNDHLAHYVKGSNVPIWIESKGPSNSSFKSANTSEIKSRCVNYLQSIAHLTKIKDPANEFEIISMMHSGTELHIRLKQKHKGIPIYGNEVIVHFVKGKTSFNGRYIPSSDFSTIQPTISNSDAISSAILDLKNSTNYRELTSQEKQLLDYSGPVAELIYYPKAVSSPELILSYKIDVRPNPLDHFVYFINALNGTIIYKSNHTCTTGPVVSTAADLNGVSHNFGTYQNGSTFYMIDISKSMYSAGLSQLPDNPIGAIWTIDAKNTDLTDFQHVTSSSQNVWPATAVSAHTNADSAYNYYKTVHGRNSLDNNGGTIISVINVTQNGQGMDNAYWNGKFMAYGNGKTYFKPLAGGLDVAAHEMTHGVIQNTANLNYEGESGAINESMADIFGCMVDRNNWSIGEDVMSAASATYYPTHKLRDLSDPHNGGSSGNDPSWQPMHMNEFVSTTSDHGGVHTNSGIPNYAFYLFATSAGVNKSIAEKVYYKALTTYLTASSQFIDLRIAVIQAANDLYSNNLAIADAAAAAFINVGIGPGSGTTQQNDLSPNDGDELMIVHGLSDDPNSIYNVTLNPFSLSAISDTRLRNKISITDDGKYGYFVDEQGQIRMHAMGAFFDDNELVIDNSRTWDNVAVSRDGSLLAAVTDQIDSSIYVRPVNGSAWTRFKLYNPTFSQGITTDGPLYADAIEWDHTGEYVMYDCYNLTKNSNNDTIDYWNIGVINVWDNNAGTFTSGEIKNLFDGLPTYLNIGNPTFAKNSKNIVAFDVVDYSDSTLYIVGTNIETGTSGILVSGNNTLGYPSYSKNDDSLAFTTVFQSDTSIFIVDVASDKINYNPLGSFYNLVTYGQVPVYYSNGKRVLGTTNAMTSATDINVFPNPFADDITIQFTMKKQEPIEIELYDMVGKPIKTLYNGEAINGNNSFAFTVPDIKEGSYLIKIKTEMGSVISKVIKVK